MTVLPAPDLRAAPVTVPGVYILPGVIILLGLLNGFYNSLAVAFGYGFPYTTFCYTPGDLFADFIKAALSFPGPRIANIAAWPRLYQDYYFHNPYGGAAALAQGGLTNLHGMPLPTFILLEARRALAFGNIGLVTGCFFAAVIAPFLGVILRYCRPAAGAVAAWICALCFVLSYPFLMAVTRGNLTALMLGVCLIGVVLLVHEKRYPLLVALLLAIAINLRPNALIFLALPLLRWPLRHSIAYGFAAVFLAAGIFFAALSLSHGLYPEYALNTFYKAVLIYQKVYMAGDAGLGYGSSFLGGLKFLNLCLGSLAPASLIESAATFLAAAAIIFCAWFTLCRRMPPTPGIFCFIAIYALFSGVFGDYHLIIFFALVMLYVRRGINPLATVSSEDFRIALCVALVLAPKNYFFIDGLSAQILINPLILTWGLLAVSIPALRAPAARSQAAAGF